jgi:hypothetical protein
MWQKMKGSPRAKLVSLAALLLMSALVPFTGPAVTTYADWNDYKFTEMKFFESPYDITPYGSRTYTNRFSVDNTRYVSTEITVRNYLYRVRDFEINVLMEYVNPDGSLRGKVTGVFRVQRDWESAIYPGGWGARTGGTWPVGVYTVKLYLDGRYTGSSTFEIYKSSYQLETAKFFEAGQELPAREYWRYATSFPKNYSRYVYTEITFSNPNYKVRDNEALIVFAYYHPDGTLLQEVRNYFMIRRDWDSAYFSSGVGSNSAGSTWQYGTYTVKIYMDGQYIGSGTFYMN